jgi:hypothetical protein
MTFRHLAHCSEDIKSSCSPFLSEHMPDHAVRAEDEQLGRIMFCHVMISALRRGDYSVARPLVSL